MKIRRAILFFALIAQAAFSQRTIKGRVVDEATGGLLPAAAYLSAILLKEQYPTVTEISN